MGKLDRTATEQAKYEKNKAESKLEELWDYLCVTLDIVGDKKKLDIIRKFVNFKIEFAKKFK